MKIVHKVHDVEAFFVCIETCTSPDHLHVKDPTGRRAAHKYRLDTRNVYPRRQHTNIDQNIDLAIAKPLDLPLTFLSTSTSVNHTTRDSLLGKSGAYIFSVLTVNGKDKT